jgi:3',5'-cyclic AMP phosphodiesterase CpdA
LLLFHDPNQGMVKPFRFAVLSDLHVALPHTIPTSANRFHLVEISIPILEQILQRLVEIDLDFLLLPGDLTQHGERENHEWLVKRLQALPFPTYVVPGNHDVIVRDGGDRTLSLAEFPQLYSPFGYDSDQPYYGQEIAPDVYLLGLNSIGFDATGEQYYSGWVDEAQLDWLTHQLAQLHGKCVLAMIHHNVLDHLPNQAQHPLGKRYVVDNRADLLQRLQAANVRLLFTGHLHVQDVAQLNSLWEITTGSLVSYPHPYRLIEITPQSAGNLQVKVESFRVRTVPGWEDLQAMSLQRMRDRALPFMTRLLTSPPFDLPVEKAAAIAPGLEDFWAAIAAGDTYFDYAHLPTELNQLLQRFGALDADGNYQPIDNHTVFQIPH